VCVRDASSDDRIVTFTIKYDDVRSAGLPPTWFNLYGAPHGECVTGKLRVRAD
jgi:hypothetical protein